MEPKIDQKSMSNLITFLIDFWIDFLMNFGILGKQKSLKTIGFSMVFEDFCFLLEHQILIDFGSKMGPKMVPKWTKNGSKIDTKINKKND